MGDLYNQLLFQPIYNLLIWLHNILPGHDVGWAIIIITLLIRLILYPLSKKGLESQKALQILQPKMAELQKKYKDNREELARQTLALYKEHKVNTFASIGPMLVQLPVLIALYDVFNRGFKNETFSVLYSFVAAPENVNHFWFGVFDLSLPNLALGILAGVAQYYQMKIMFRLRPSPAPAAPGQPDMARIMQKQMMFMSPVMIAIFSFGLPAALPLYWLVSTLFTVGQEFALARSKAPASSKA